MEETGTPASDRPSNRFSSRRVKLFVAVVLLAAAGAAVWWFMTRNRVSTDDAYARADSAQVSGRVPGTVLRVLVDNDFWAEAGQVLAALDPADYRVADDRVSWWPE